MGVKLMVEVMDHWRDAGLTKGERDDLHVIAENANDVTRETFGPIHEDYILRRADKKPESWRNSIDALKRKGVLEYAVHDGREMSGRRGRYAVYRIRVLCPEAPHDGYKGYCTRPERVTPEVTLSGEWVTPQVTHSETLGNPPDDPSKRLGNPRNAEWVTPGMTPTPLSPSYENPPQDQPPPPPAASPPNWLAPAAEGEEVQEEGEGDFQEPNAEATALAEVFADKLPYDRKPSGGERAELIRLAALALAAGWPEDELLSECERDLDGVRNRIGLWIKTRLKPDSLGAPPKVKFAPPAANGARPKCWRCDGNRTVWSFRGSCKCPFCGLSADAAQAEEDALWAQARSLGIEMAGVEQENGTVLRWPPKPVVPKPRDSSEHQGWR